MTDGGIIYNDHHIQNLSPEEITRLGIIQVLEGRQPFKYLTIEENLKVGTATRWTKPYKKDLELVYHYFPALTKRRKTMAGYCSGGELQMVVMGRALMAHPKLLLLDEPSLGLAPLVVRRSSGSSGGSTRSRAPPSSSWSRTPTWRCRSPTYGYVMENGKIVMEGEAEA